MESSFSTEEEERETGGKRREGAHDDKNSANPSNMVSTPEELTLLVASDKPNDATRHFNLKAVMKAEKRSKHAGKKKRKASEQEDETQDDFIINLKDDRFKSIHDNHAFAIDPSNPQYVLAIFSYNFCPSYRTVSTRRRAWSLFWTKGRIYRKIVAKIRKQCLPTAARIR